MYFSRGRLVVYLCRKGCVLLWLLVDYVVGTVAVDVIRCSGSGVFPNYILQKFSKSKLSVKGSHTGGSPSSQMVLQNIQCISPHARAGSELTFMHIVTGDTLL
jgi:hypothetical protein